MTKDILQDNIISWDLVIIYPTKDFVSSSSWKGNEALIQFKSYFVVWCHITECDIILK